MKYKLSEIAALASSQLKGPDRSITSVVTDSRGFSQYADALFIAIKGVSRNGHDYIEQMYTKGVRAFIVSETPDTNRFPEAGFIECTNTVQALQQWAAVHRASFKGRVVAITGSNGKTVTKEWIAQLCPAQITLFRSPKSYNSQIGVPLSLLMLRKDEDLAVIEAGISQPSEMQTLEAMIRPDIGIITNIGEAHQEGFVSIDEKIQEKLSLFEHTPVIIYGNDNRALQQAIETRFADRMLIPVTPSQYPLQKLPYTDSASRENAAQALALFEVLGVDMKPIVKGLSTLQSVAMRLELKDGINGCKVVDDSYNSDVNSLSLALDYLSIVAGGREKVLILSDIQQSGQSEAELYGRVAEMVADHNISMIVGVGAQIFRHADLFSCRKEFYLTTDNFLSSYSRLKFTNQAILVKGSRSFHFEKVSRALSNKIHTTILEVNLDNMIHNLNYFRGMLPAGVKLMAMVKALGYGSGTYEVANMLQNQGVDYLAVAFADEGVTLREEGITMPIVVLNADSDSFDLMLDYHLEPEIYSFSSLRSFAEAAEKRGESRYPVHIKLDTGMHRLGFTEQDTDRVVSEIKRTKSLRISTIFSHFAGSDEAQHDSFTQKQIARYQAMSSRITAAFPEEKIIRHLCNSAGIERFPEACFDMVRLGIGLYGISVEHQQALRGVSTLKSRIVQIKNLSAGETVGYGRHGKVIAPMRTATVPIGYADGLNRHLGRGRWSMLVGGVKAPIIGNVCMDTCMLDVTGIEAKEGDTVVVFGEGATVSEMAQVLDTIPYEVMTGISSRVKRVYTKE